MRNARFWVYVNGGPVKITLKPNQRLGHHVGGPCEEGWFSEFTEWIYPPDETRVYRKHSSESQDCDGRHGYGGEDSCHIDDLAMGNEPYVDEYDDPATWNGVVWPNWAKEKDYGVYDQYAQQMGY